MVRRGRVQRHAVLRDPGPADRRGRGLRAPGARPTGGRPCPADRDLPGPTAVLFGRSVLALRLVQSVYGTLGVVAIALLARRVAGSDRVALWAALAAAVYPNLWAADGVIMAETLTVLLVAGPAVGRLRLPRPARPAAGRCWSALWPGWRRSRGPSWRWSGCWPSSRWPCGSPSPGPGGSAIWASPPWPGWSSWPRGPIYNAGRFDEPVRRVHQRRPDPHRGQLRPQYDGRTPACGTSPACRRARSPMLRPGISPRSTPTTAAWPSTTRGPTRVICREWPRSGWPARGASMTRRP